MPTATRQALIQRYCEELWNGWNFALVDSLIDPNIVFRGSLGIEVKGWEGFVSYMRTVRAAFPDFRHLVEEVIEEGDAMAVRLTLEGTHRGPVFGIAPTGKHVRYAAVALFHFAQDRIARGWVLGDIAGLRSQLEG